MELQSNDRLCSGCRACLLTCSLANFNQVNPNLAALAVEARLPAPGDYRLRLCDQCGVCAEVCPEEAIYQREGTYMIDRELCTDCRLCVDSCPHEAMFVHRTVHGPIKCTLCGECAQVCPRTALLMEADHD